MVLFHRSCLCIPKINKILYALDFSDTHYFYNNKFSLNLAFCVELVDEHVVRKVNLKKYSLTTSDFSLHARKMNKSSMTYDLCMNLQITCTIKLFLTCTTSGNSASSLLYLRTQNYCLQMKRNPHLGN